MRKKTIVILFSIGFGLDLLGWIFAGVVVMVLAAAQQGCMPNCDPSAATGLILLTVIGILIAFAGSILFMIAWIATLIKQAQRKQWAWFVCTLLFSSICMLIWLIVEPEYVVPLYQPVQQMGMPYPPGYSYLPAQTYQGESSYYQQQSYRPPQE